MRTFWATCMGSVCVCACVAAGQSRSSFQAVDSLTGITVTANVRQFTVEVSDAPVVRYNGVDYTINSVFGFWCLSDDEDFMEAAGANFDVWRYVRNSSGSGDLAGWRTNPNTGLEPSESETFLFQQFKNGSPTHFGFHVRVDGTIPGIGNTIYIEAPAEPCPADYNNDGVINEDDYNGFLSDWGNGLPAADLNHDGAVDGSDVHVFFNPWKMGGCV